MEIMNVIEKRDFIHSHLHQVDDSLIDQLYETLRREDVLRAKLINRAEKSEDDIRKGLVYTRSEMEQKTE
jgi:hypothetical protein